MFAKTPSRVRDGDKRVAGRNGREEYFPDEDSKICPKGKSMIFFKKGDTKNWVNGHTWWFEELCWSLRWTDWPPPPPPQVVNAPQLLAAGNSIVTVVLNCSITQVELL